MTKPLTRIVAAVARLKWQPPNSGPTRRTSPAADPARTGDRPGCVVAARWSVAVPTGHVRLGLLPGPGGHGEHGAARPGVRRVRLDCRATRRPSSGVERGLRDVAGRLGSRAVVAVDQHAGAGGVDPVGVGGVGDRRGLRRDVHGRFGPADRCARGRAGLCGNGGRAVAGTRPGWPFSRGRGCARRAVDPGGVAVAVGGHRVVGVDGGEPRCRCAERATGRHR
jgi:hypothetical protein